MKPPHHLGQCNHSLPILCSCSAPATPPAHIPLTPVAILLPFPPPLLPCATVLLPKDLSCSLPALAAPWMLGAEGLAPKSLGFQTPGGHPTFQLKSRTFFGAPASLCLFHLSMQPTSPSLLPEHSFPRGITHQPPRYSKPWHC